MGFIMVLQALIRRGILSLAPALKKLDLTFMASAGPRIISDAELSASEAK